MTSITTEGNTSGDSHGKALNGTRRLGMVVDVVACIALGALALFLRDGTLTTDGLWFDDSWVAAGAIHGNVTNIMTTGSGHPGFTIMLMLIDRLGGDLRSLTYPALFAGTIGPPAIYLGLRSLGFARSIGVIMGSALVVADLHIIYSGRVKVYTLDAVLILALAVALPRLARARWTPVMATAWVVLALALGSMSGYVLLATAVAAVVLFLNPASDRPVRFCALVAQGSLQLVYYLWAQRSTNLADIESVMERLYDGHMDFYWNPFEMAGEVLTHLQRVVTVFPGGSGGWLSLFGVLAVSGLVIAVTRSRDAREKLPAQYFLLILAIALVGAILDRFPFGTTTEYFVSSGGRHSMWMAPAFAFGLAVILQRVRRLASGRWRPLRRGFDVAVLVAAALIVVDGYDTPIDYPFPGSETATAFIDAELGPDDMAIITQAAVYSFANSTDLDVSTFPTPDRQIGFGTRYQDDRVLTVGSFGEFPSDPEVLRPLVEDADRVLVYTSGLYGTGNVQKLIDKTLEPLGFARDDEHATGYEVVTIWTR